MVSTGRENKAKYCGSTSHRGPSSWYTWIADFNSEFFELGGMLIQKSLGCLSTMYRNIRLVGGAMAVGEFIVVGYWKDDNLGEWAAPV